MSLDMSQCGLVPRYYVGLYVSVLYNIMCSTVSTNIIQLLCTSYVLRTYSDVLTRKLEIYVYYQFVRYNLGIVI